MTLSRTVSPTNHSLQSQRHRYCVITIP